MKTLLKIAWRSLWRNRRRTVLTAASVFIAIVLALFMRSMQKGSYAQMISAGVNQTGYLQVHEAGYQDNQTIERAFFSTPEILRKIENTQGVTEAVPRTETFALASFGDKTKGVLISGIAPGQLNRKMNIPGHTVAGMPPDTTPGGVVIGKDLAKYLNIGVGDSLVLIGQGYRGITSYGIYHVKGIFRLPSHDVNSRMVFMNIEDAQDFVYPYQPGLLTTISVYIDNEENLPRIQKAILQKLGGAFEVISWKVILADMLQAIRVDNVSGQIMLIILYIIAAFGIFSTVLMMTMEKKKQYAVMISLGMRRSKLIKVSFWETLIIIFTGIAAGLIVIIPVLVYLHAHPIPITGEAAEMFLQYNIEPVLPFSIKSSIFIAQTSIITGLALLSVFYPVIYLARFNVLKAFRH